MAYGRKFFYHPVMGDLSLDGRRVLEGMCGSGPATDYLLERGTRATGLDISPRATIARLGGLLFRSATVG